MPKREPKTPPVRQWWVYVVELDPVGLANAEKGAFYVGQTEKSPEDRFATHMAGGKTASPIVAKRGVRLRPDLYPADSPFDTEDGALTCERETAERLREAGYRVKGGQGNPWGTYNATRKKGKKKAKARRDARRAAAETTPIEGTNDKGPIP